MRRPARIRPGMALASLALVACSPGLRMTGLAIESEQPLELTRVYVHQDGCDARVPEDAMRLDGPVPPRLPAGRWTVVVEGHDGCEVVAEGCVEVELPAEEPIRVALTPKDGGPIVECDAGFACRMGECLCVNPTMCRPPPCGDLDYTGYCDGHRLVWCEMGIEPTGRWEMDCAATGRTCGWGGSIGFTCMGPIAPSEPLSLSEIVGGAHYEILQAYGSMDFAGDPETRQHYEHCPEYGGTADAHCGIDLGIPRGTTLHAPANGTVKIAPPHGPFRDHLDPLGGGDLRFELPDGTLIMYGHVSQVAVWDGKVVAGGEPVATSGDYEGPRLHIEVRQDGTVVDPLELFER